MSLIKKIQSKSPAARAFYAFWFSVGITGFIALIWVTTIPARFSESEKTHESSLGGIKEALIETKDQVANSIGSELEKNTSEVSELEALSQQRVLENQPVTDVNEQNIATSTERDLGNVFKTQKKEKETTATNSLDVSPPKPKVILIGTTTIQKDE